MDLPRRTYFPMSGDDAEGVRMFVRELYWGSMNLCHYGTHTHTHAYALNPIANDADILGFSEVAIELARDAALYLLLNQFKYSDATPLAIYSIQILRDAFIARGKVDKYGNFMDADGEAFCAAIHPAVMNQPKSTFWEDVVVTDRQSSGSIPPIVWGALGTSAVAVAVLFMKTLTEGHLNLDVLK